MIYSVKATISAQNTWTDALRVGVPEQTGLGRKAIYATAVMTDAATVSVQAKKPGSDTWITIHQFAQSDIQVGYLVGTWDLRIGVATGDFVSADVEVEVGIG